MSSPAFIGLDIETTGLDERFDVILENGIVIFDRRLKPLAANSWVVQPRENHPALDQMGTYVASMHMESGLSADLEDGQGQSISTVSVEAREFIRKYTDEKLPMLGASVTLDRTFLANYAPELLEDFHYRSLDATSVKLGALTQVPPGDMWTAEKVIDDETAVFRETLLDEVAVQPHYRKPHRPIYDLCTSAALIMSAINLGKGKR